LIAGYPAKIKPQGGERVAREISGKRLFDDGDTVLIKTVPFGIHHWLLGNFYVGFHGIGLVAKSTWEEKTFLLAVLGELAKRGVRLPDERLDGLFEQFALAIANRESVRWRLFFRSGSVVDSAAEYAKGEGF
jgi:hypothetical protein